MTFMVLDGNNDIVKKDKTDVTKYLTDFDSCQLYPSFHLSIKYYYCAVSGVRQWTKMGWEMKMSRVKTLEA